MIILNTAQVDSKIEKLDIRSMGFNSPFNQVKGSKILFFICLDYYYLKGRDF